MSTEINEASEAKQSKQSGKAGKIIAGILVSGCLAASLGLNIYQAVVPSQKTAEFIDYMYERIAEAEKSENEYIEDGYMVGGEYEIRSTTHISDAYKNGDASQLSDEDKETLEMAEAVLDEVIEDGMSDYEKERAVYQWMVQNIGGSSRGVISRPGMDRSAFTPHDVLASKSAVCVGYATTFRLLLNMMDIDVHIVHNDYHSWDLVNLDDGWYHVDIYSDAHGTMYANFNMTDEICESGHSWDQSALPEAKSVKYSPAVQNAVEVADVYAVPAAIKQIMEEDGSSAMYFKFKTTLTDADISAAEFLVNQLEMVLCGGMLEGPNYYYMRAYWYPGEDGNDILGLLLECDDEGEDESDVVDFDSPEGKKIIESIAAAFELDPALLGGGDEGGEPGWEDYPVENGETYIDEDGNTVTIWTDGSGGGAIIN